MVRPKDSAAPLNLRETGATMEESRPSSQDEMNFNDQTVYSYQQISCLDSVVRYSDEHGRDFEFLVVPGWPVWHRDL